MIIKQLVVRVSSKQTGKSYHIYFFPLDFSETHAYPFLELSPSTPTQFLTLHPDTPLQSFLALLFFLRRLNFGQRVEGFGDDVRLGEEEAPYLRLILTSAHVQNSSGTLSPPQVEISGLWAPIPPSFEQVVPKGFLYSLKYLMKFGGEHVFAVAQYHWTTQCSHTKLSGSFNLI